MLRWSSSPRRRSSRIETTARSIPGLCAAVTGVLAAWLVHLAIPAVPLLTAAVVLGIVVGQLPQLREILDGRLGPGIRLSSRTLMRAGIVLLGLKLSLTDIAELGWVSILAIVALVVATFLGTWGLGRIMRLPGDQPLLIAAGFSICGASAIGAMGAATRGKPADQATPVALVTLCGTLAIAVLPALQGPLGLSNEHFGHWVGASVHDVGQVVATAQTAGSAALATAVVVKLTRVLMLAPMVTTASAVLRHREVVDPRRVSESVTPPVIPIFVLGFLAAVLLNSFLPIPEPALRVADLAQTMLLAAALFALGTSVRVGQLLRTGWRALVVGFASWLLIAALALLTVGL
ncbi:MAG: hypothetical protein JWL94_1159 [Microbacteriaceae bacterium]|nr:hypothetical protein [Microbacteriaceae bacterium]HEV7957536.1 putative sulfate exporter family transporter [Marisediminicola sp.]